MARQAALAAVATLFAWCLAGAAGAQPKVVIRSLESGDSFQVQFNPTEIAVKKQVPWKSSKSDVDELPDTRFAGVAPASLEVQLAFDNDLSDVSPLIAPLEQLARPDPATNRPPLVQFEWGSGFPPFRGVIEQIDVTYTLFLADGTPVRAVVKLTLQEATHVKGKKGGAAEVESCDVDADCPSSQKCFAGACAPPP
jgi:hypothetical protein